VREVDEMITLNDVKFTETKNKDGTVKIIASVIFMTSAIMFEEEKGIRETAKQMMVQQIEYELTKRMTHFMHNKTKLTLGTFNVFATPEATRSFFVCHPETLAEILKDNDSMAIVAFLGKFR